MIVSYPVTHPSLCYPSRLVIMKIKTSTRNPSRIPVGNQDVRRSEPSKKIYATWKLTWQMEKNTMNESLYFLLNIGDFKYFQVSHVKISGRGSSSWNPGISGGFLDPPWRSRICRVSLTKRSKIPACLWKKTRGYGDLLPLCVGRSVATRSLAIAAGGGWTNRSVLLVWTFA